MTADGESSGGQSAEGHWFEGVAEHLGEAYLRYSFTKGTVNEVDTLVRLAGLEPGQRALDVGCGPGRHAHELARRGIEVVGVDISETFVELAHRDAPPGASFRRGDARRLDIDGEFDLVYSLCQGGFGLLGGPASTTTTGAEDGDLIVLSNMARAARPAGHVILSAFNAYFQVRHLDDDHGFDAAAGVNHENTVIKDPDGNDAETQLWTTCYTPRELRLLARTAGLVEVHVLGATPGSYGDVPPSVDLEEHLLHARRA